MREKPDTLHDLLRAALRAQVDFGVGEIIINRANVRPVATSTAAPPEPAGIETDRSAVVSRMTLVRHADTPSPTLFGSPVGEPAPSAFASLDDHNKAICDCQDCPLGQTRTRFVYGVGNPGAELMFIGEAPGHDEDLKGEPFVGKAGQLLDRILAAMKMARGEVYIANVLKCRPPNNRDPLPEEMAACLPYLLEQIRLIRPKVLCALGRIAGQALLDTRTPLGKLRRVWHEFQGIPLLVTYHPAALLRFPAYKKDTWDDMQLVMAKLDELHK